MDARDKRQVLGGYPAILCPTWAHRFSQSTLNISRPPIDEETSAQRRTSGERHFWNGLEDIHILRAAARAPHMLNMLLTQVLPYCCRRLASSAATKMNGGIDQWNRPHFHWKSNTCQFGRDLLGHAAAVDGPTGLKSALGTSIFKGHFEKTLSMCYDHSPRRE